MTWILVIMMCAGPAGCVPAYAEPHVNMNACMQAASDLRTTTDYKTSYCVPQVKRN